MQYKNPFFWCRFFRIVALSYLVSETTLQKMWCHIYITDVTEISADFRTCVSLAVGSGQLSWQEQLILVDKMSSSDTLLPIVLFTV